VTGWFSQHRGNPGDALTLACSLARSEQRSLLEKCAQTALNSKLIAHQKEFFGEMAVDAVLSLEDDLNLKMIGVKKVAGGSLTDSVLVKGVAFKKTFSYAGFEQQPKKFSDPLICLLNVELELKSEKDNAEVRIKDVADYQAFVDAEWKIIYDKLDAIVATGAKVVLSRLAIGDLATQYFADRDIFCAGRVTEDDMERVAKATGGAVQNTCSDLIAEVMGKCGNFEEVQVGAERYNFFKECPEAKTATIVLRGGAEQFIEEAHRSLHDAICIVRRAMKHSYIVPGGGAIEMELSKILRAHSRTIAGKQQLVINAFAKALEVVPRMISQNAGFDSTDILNKLRQKHAAGGKYFGVDIMNDGICDTHETFVWEPANIKQNAISIAVEVV
jgi:T-complex protein 1 subunit eta